MRRDLKKAIEAYQKRFYGTSEGSFYMDDVYQIIDMVDSSRTDSMSYAVSYALEAGFMIGYKKAQRDYRKRSVTGSPLEEEKEAE